MVDLANSCAQYKSWVLELSLGNSRLTMDECERMYLHMCVHAYVSVCVCVPICTVFYQQSTVTK